MAFVLQDVINEIEETRSLEPLKNFKTENLIKVTKLTRYKVDKFDIFHS